MKSKTKRIIFVATQDELKSKSYYRRLWVATRNIKLSRRLWLDEIADTLRDFDGVIIHRSGLPYNVPCIDEAFGNDPEIRWMSYYMLADGSGQYPKIQTRKYQRLQLLDLYFRIRHPQIARHFSV